MVRTDQWSVYGYLDGVFMSMLQECDEALGLVMIAAQSASVAVDTAFVLGGTHCG